MTGWLIGHPDYKDLWAAACIWNGVLDMAYMVTSTDIPDWIYACCLKKDFNFFKEDYSSELGKAFIDKSPISVVRNVKTPTLILVGSGDRRVPPHQSYFYYHSLLNQKVPTKLLNYPDSGHSLLQNNEHFHDASINISLWMDKFTNKSE